MNCPLNCPYLVIGKMWHYECKRFGLGLGKDYPLRLGKCREEQKETKEGGKP